MSSHFDLDFVFHTEASIHLADLNMASARGHGLKSLIAFMAAEMQRESKGAFLRRRNPSTGHTWPTRKHQYPHPVLRKSGELWASVLGDFEMLDEGKAKAVVHVPLSSPSADYAFTHQFGSSDGKIDARPYAGLSDEGRKKVIQHALGPKGLLQS